ncbi:bifunctional riboflavin kinase/FAD synthetase [Sphingosinicella sp. LHD-64]|uniref:bifunctional riboflavin kinase/FAD synthetase n=1 Tax=Sphingosinicella sp. LHD-64 TaxID=3072139 RepID=UPI00280D1147|nr:bifunctional riboflavin kinase/FAD synthetase [Sphingosinicella sp. LHD-64]MDQ8755687.1 bifunctional riboflavin kinase/FAD synthetase [Sphingosinicella sp. LHD-64]
MERLDGGSAVPAHLRGGIVALGNFDGFHKGHQAVVGRAVSRARAEGRPALVATFDPHPVRFFKPDVPPFRLTTLDQRERLFAGAGADAMLVFHFDATLAAVPAPEFVADHLIGRIGAAGVVTGEDFTFGKGRGGNVEVLKLLGQANRISVDAVAPVADGGEPVSSSRIREALQAGDCATATALLTRPFAIEGVVEHGDKRGRELGYPTANLGLGQYLRPRFGVYAVRGTLPDGRVLDGVANLGTRPMFDAKELLEPFFFDFSGDLYGQRIEVRLIAFLRDEASFDGLDALTAQIARDVLAAKAALAAAGPLA